MGGFGRSAPPHRTVRLREEFRAPAGVRKSPRKEPADYRLMLWRFRFSAEARGGETATRKLFDGYRQVASLRLRAALTAWHPSRWEHIDASDLLRRMWVGCRRREACGWSFCHSMPGHEAASRVVFVACGGPRGRLHLSTPPTKRLRRIASMRSHLAATTLKLAASGRRPAGKGSRTTPSPSSASASTPTWAATPAKMTWHCRPSSNGNPAIDCSGRPDL